MGATQADLDRLEARRIKQLDKGDEPPTVK
jgi:hypothetical protein